MLNDDTEVGSSTLTSANSPLLQLLEAVENVKMWFQSGRDEECESRYVGDTDAVGGNKKD